MNTLLRLLPMLLAAGLSLSAAEPAKPVKIFDGKTFAGWEGDTNKTFRIVDGAIVGGSMSANVPRNEFLATTRQYTNFVLRLEFKLLGGAKANGGVQIRTQRIPNHHEVSGYQADMGDGWWGCIYDESRRNKVVAKADPALTDKLVKRNEWNSYEIRCEGKRIRLAINGTQTVDFTEEDDKIPQFGIIAVQIHGGPPSEAWYRNFVLEELP
ncbi:MAG: DUF1080 domain-containing protein [Proteobacteria bacterium]|nr:DUF1080 domain-containing protein [Pseudomonadota bacterium]